MGIIIKNILVKAYNLISIIECYYSPLQCIYYIITFKILEINKNIVL